MHDVTIQSVLKRNEDPRFYVTHLLYAHESTRDYSISSVYHIPSQRLQSSIKQPSNLADYYVCKKLWLGSDFLTIKTHKYSLSNEMLKMTCFSILQRDGYWYYNAYVHMNSEGTANLNLKEFEIHCKVTVKWLKLHW